MRLKKVFAGALAAAMLVCAVAVPAFAAEEVEQENGLTSSYVQMNIPYADFYKAAGVDNASEIDAVTSATKNKTRAGNLAAGEPKSGLARRLAREFGVPKSEVYDAILEAGA